MFLNNLILRLALWTYTWGEIKFKGWLRLEGIKEKVVKAVAEGSDEFPVLVVEFVATALRVPASYIQDAEWSQMVRAFYEIMMRQPRVSLPLTEPSRDDPKPDDWDYDGRTWQRYSHLLAHEYGWTLEYISRLPVFEALAKIQEILTDQQLEREFYYGLSEIAYPYDAQSKKSYYKPLQRPHWMRPKVNIDKIPRIKMPVAALPMGNVNYDALPENLKPQTPVH